MHGVIYGSSTLVVCVCMCVAVFQCKYIYIYICVSAGLYVRRHIMMVSLVHSAYIYSVCFNNEVRINEFVFECVDFQVLSLYVTFSVLSTFQICILIYIYISS